MLIAEPEKPSLLRCPSCGSSDFVQIWEGYLYTRGALALYGSPSSDWTFEGDGYPEFGKGEVAGWECANCGTDVDPDDLVEADAEAT